MDVSRLLEVAQGLVSDDGENTEYDRAIVEFATQLLALQAEEAYTVARILGVNPSAIRKAP